MKSLEDAVGVALQIVFEYPDWTQEHVEDMFKTYESSGEEPPCSFDELEDLTIKAGKLKNSGMTWDQAEAQLTAKSKP